MSSLSLCFNYFRATKHPLFSTIVLVNKISIGIRVPHESTHFLRLVFHFLAFQWFPILCPKFLSVNQWGMSRGHSIFNGYFLQNLLLNFLLFWGKFFVFSNGGKARVNSSLCKTSCCHAIIYFQLWNSEIRDSLLTLGIIIAAGGAVKVICIWAKNPTNFPETLPWSAKGRGETVNCQSSLFLFTVHLNTLIT